MKKIESKHIGTYAIIIRDKKIALVEKANGAYKGKFDLPGGGIEHGERPDMALKRECNEEIGATVAIFNLLDVTSFNVVWNIKEDLVEDLHHIGILYIVEIKESVLKSDSDGRDSNGGRWVDIVDLTKDVCSPFLWYSLKLLGYK